MYYDYSSGVCVPASLVEGESNDRLLLDFVNVSHMWCCTLSDGELAKLRSLELDLCVD